MASLTSAEEFVDAGGDVLFAGSGGIEKDLVTMHSVGLKASEYRGILGLLEDKVLNRKLRVNARAYAERKLPMAGYLDSYCNLIARLTGEIPPPLPKPRRRAA
jgi:hypothetical protein